MSIYMYIPGIAGPVTAKNYERWIELSGFEFGVNNHVEKKIGSSRLRISAAPDISELEISKPFDKSSPSLLQHAVQGKVIAQVKIDLCKTDNPPKPYCQYTLSQVLVAGRNLFHAASSHLPIEIIRLNFCKIEERFTPYNNADVAESPVTVGYDILQGQIV